MQKPLYSEDGWRCCVIMNFIIIRRVMYELCFMISGGVILYFFSMGVNYDRMAGPAVVCASALVGYLRENKRHSALQELYEKLED
jgi:hypothetical protein